MVRSSLIALLLARISSIISASPTATGHLPCLRHQVSSSASSSRTMESARALGFVSHRIICLVAASGAAVSMVSCLHPPCTWRKCPEVRQSECKCPNPIRRAQASVCSNRRGALSVTRQRIAFSSAARYAALQAVCPYLSSFSQLLPQASASTALSSGADLPSRLVCCKMPFFCC
jgi:hypothetical protein